MRTRNVYSLEQALGKYVGPATTQNLVVKFDGEICGGVLVENASDDFPQQKKLENLLPNFAGSSPPISPKTSPTSPCKSLVLKYGQKGLDRLVSERVWGLQTGNKLLGTNVCRQQLQEPMGHLYPKDPVILKMLRS